MSEPTLSPYIVGNVYYHLFPQPPVMTGPEAGPPYGNTRSPTTEEELVASGKVVRWTPS